MRNFVRNIIFVLFIFLSTALASLAAEDLKIDNLIFDEADGIIFIETRGELNGENLKITKGYLKDPNRIYIDIENSILTTQKKEYIEQYSVLNNIKISQFSTEPNTVRLVFEYNEGLELSAFKVLKSEKGLFIKLKQNITSSPRHKTVYRNSKANERTVFYKGTKSKLQETPATAQEINLINGASSEILKDLSPKENPAKISSNYYIDNISANKNGILISGAGKINVIPSFSLQDPERLIIDLDDTVVNSDLRNKVYTIGEDSENKETLKIGQNSQSIARIVIEGEKAKEYRWIISPDSKMLYLTNKKNIITATMSDSTANLTKTAYSNSNGWDIISLGFDESVCFGIFEDNSNLYIDIANLNTFDDTIFDPISRAGFEYKTIRLALDKFRLIIPVSNKDIIVKTDLDNTEMRISTKPAAKEKKSIGSILVPISISKKDTSEISNLFTVVIDAGHGGSDVGATRVGVFEKDITLKIAKMVEKNLNKKKVKTYMVRDKDVYVSLAERSDFSNEKKPDVFVSIHVNSSTNEEITGVETHWWKEDSQQYASVVHREFTKKIKNWKTNDRGLFKSQFYVINHTDAPAILCEIGFISNKAERDEITKEKRQEDIADAITNGIYNYLKMRK